MFLIQSAERGSIDHHQAASTTSMIFLAVSLPAGYSYPEYTSSVVSRTMRASMLFGLRCVVGVQG